MCGLRYCELSDYNFTKSRRTLKNIPSDKIVLSSPEPLASQGELIVYPCSVVVRPSTIFKHHLPNSFSNQSQIYINSPGHMTKMAATPIYISSPKPLGQSKPNFMWSLLGKGDKWSRSHGQDGCYAHIW